MLCTIALQELISYRFKPTNNLLGHTIFNVTHFGHFFQKCFFLICKSYSFFNIDCSFSIYCHTGTTTSHQNLVKKFICSFSMLHFLTLYPWSYLYWRKSGPLWFLYGKCCQKTFVSYGNHNISQSHKKSELQTHIYSFTNLAIL